MFFIVLLLTVILSACCYRWSDCIDNNSDLFAVSADSILTLMSTVKTHQRDMEHSQADRLQQVIMIQWVISRDHRDHSFPWHTEFWAKPQNLPISAEFLMFFWKLAEFRTGWW